MTVVAVPRVEVTEIATGHRFVRASTLAAAMCVYRHGYRLRVVWGIPMRDGFHYLTCEDSPTAVS